MLWMALVHSPYPHATIKNIDSTAALAVPASAQVAVYRLSFSPSGDNINYNAFQNGYYVAPVQGGTGEVDQALPPWSITVIDIRLAQPLSVAVDR